MKTEEIKHHLSQFENAKSEVDGIECWSACKHSGENTGNHFPDVGKMVTIGSEAERPIEGIVLTVMHPTSLLRMERVACPK